MNALKYRQKKFKHKDARVPQEKQLDSSCSRINPPSKLGSLANSPGKVTASLGIRLVWAVLVASKT